MFSKKDLLFSIFTGTGAGLIAWRIFNFLNFQPFQGISFVWLILIVPVLWIMGVNLGYWLGRWMSFFNQFGKFAAVGFTNAAVDFGVLNSLLAMTGITSGVYFSLFKTISFFVALINSYFLNKYWAFNAGKAGVDGIEFIKFVGVAVVATLINVGVASYVVNYLDPLFGFSSALWANIGAVAGSACALITSFVGFKLLVFKTRIDVISN